MKYGLIRHELSKPRVRNEGMDDFRKEFSEEVRDVKNITVFRKFLCFIDKNDERF